jgi:hypothetical protein
MKKMSKMKNPWKTWWIFQSRRELIQRLAVWVAQKWSYKAAFFVPILIALVTMVIGGVAMDGILEYVGKEWHWIWDGIVGFLLFEIVLVFWLVLYFLGL